MLFLDHIIIHSGRSDTEHAADGNVTGSILAKFIFYGIGLFCDHQWLLFYALFDAME